MLKKKEAFSDAFSATNIPRKKQNLFVGTPDFFVGLGYKFLHLELLKLAVGLEYQFQLPHAFSYTGTSETKLDSIHGWTADYFVNTYFSLKFTLLKNFPFGITTLLGLGFRDAHELIIKEASAPWWSNGTLWISPKNKGVDVGLNLGLRFTAGPLFIGINYNLFPNSWAGSVKGDMVNSFIFTGGFGWMI